MSGDLHTTPELLDDVAHAAHVPIEIDPVTHIGHLHLDGLHYVADLTEETRS